MNKNKKTTGFLTLFLTLSCAYAMAGETVSLPQVNLSVPSQAASAKLPFSMIVTRDGNVITKPGAIFTAGIEAADLELPYLVSTPRPIRYPNWAVREGWQGDFVIAIEVLKNGSVGRYYVMQSTGHDRLDNAAISAVKSWKFQPAMQKGRAVVTCVQLPITFELQG